MMKVNSVIRVITIIFASLALMACVTEVYVEDGAVTGPSLQGTVVFPEGYQDRDLEDVVVTLTEIGNPTPRITTADQEGNYEFRNVTRGVTHIVRAELYIEDDDRLIGETGNINANSASTVKIEPMLIKLSLLTQELTIELTVVDAATGKPISGAPITMRITGKTGATCLTCTTDSLGTFSSSASAYGGILKRETVAFQVSKEGYVTQVKETQTQGLKRELVTVLIALVRNSPAFQVGTDNDWRVVENGENHSIALKNDGSLYEWGNYNYSALKGDHDYQPYPAQVGNDYDWATITSGNTNNYAIKKDGTLWGWGSHIMTPVLFDEDAWAYVATSFSASLGIKSNGTLWLWGLELNSPGDAIFNTPAQVGTNSHWQEVVVDDSGIYALALRDDNSLWAWGGNNCGQLGNGNTTDIISPVQIGSAKDWRAVAIGGSHSREISLGLKSDGTLWAWGCGEGSLKMTTPVQIGMASDWQILSGNTNIKLLKTDRTLWSWGGGYAVDPTQIESDSDWQVVTAGRHHTTAIKSNGTLWSWGNDWWGKL